MKRTDSILLTGALIAIALLVPRNTGHAAALMAVSFLGQGSKPRGIRNNNPGNIEIAGNNWQGKIPESQNTDGRFEQFTAYVYGVRAMIKLIRDSYIQKQGRNTIWKILEKYAPSHENNTQAYAAQVASRVGIASNEPLPTDRHTMRKLIQAMARVENGTDAISDDMFNLAWSKS